MSTHALEHLRQIGPVSTTTSLEYSVAAGQEYVFNIFGDGKMQYWDGGAWVDYTDAKGLVFMAPATGRVRFTVNSGTIVIHAAQITE